ncbi:hypothetical protein BaRGS_00022437, partial [Batillaria attramentaria]
ACVLPPVRPLASVYIHFYVIHERERISPGENGDDSRARINTPNGVHRTVSKQREQQLEANELRRTSSHAHHHRQYRKLTRKRQEQNHTLRAPIVSRADRQTRNTARRLRAYAQTGEGRSNWVRKRTREEGQVNRSSGHARARRRDWPSQRYGRGVVFRIATGRQQQPNRLNRSTSGHRTASCYCSAAG